jgi:D-hydroxyproline dehydrogenase subunit alpha
MEWRSEPVAETITCDVLVIGAGPAGLAAAEAAARAGASVALLDENAGPGGQIWRRSSSGLDKNARPFATQLSELGVRIVYSASVFDLPHPGVAWAETLDGVVSLRSRTTILAPGARELFLPFPGWTLPGVAGVGGLQALYKTGLELKQKRIVVAGSGPLILAVSHYFLQQRIEVAGIYEQASAANLRKFAFSLVSHPGKLRQALGMASTAGRISAGWWVKEAMGDRRLESVEVTDGTTSRTIPCEYLACAYGLIPNDELPRLAGCRLTSEGVWVDELQQTSEEGLYCAGETTGIGGVDLSLVEGRIAGLAAAGKQQEAKAFFPERQRHRQFASLMNNAFTLRDELRSLAADDTVVCRCEDIRFKELRACPDLRSAKLQTRCAMGPCQGRICGAALTHLLGWEHDRVRPPVSNVRLASMMAAGQSEIQDHEMEKQS